MTAKSEKDDPRRPMALSEIVAPRFRKSKTDSVAPMRDNPNMANDEPSRWQLRSDKEAPRLTKSKTDSVAPTRARRNTENVEPSRE
jgi:hypothetical protein